MVGVVRQRAPFVLGVPLAGLCAATFFAMSCGSDEASPDPGADGGVEGSTEAAADGGADAPVRAKYGLDTRPANPTCKAPERPPTGAPIKLERVFGNVNLVFPVAMAQFPGDKSRWFVASRGTAENGMADIVSFPVASPPATPTVVGKAGPLVWVESGEGGFLGMAFHPKCSPTSCKLFVSYVGQPKDGLVSSRSVIGYLTSTDNGATFGGFTEVLGFEETAGNTHRGGTIAFGPDGYLYISSGDGDGDEDSNVAGQSTSGKLAKILRIDVDNVPPGKTYGIPADNPFQAGGEPTAYAYGFRNPFRFSFDRGSGDLWVGDVGQNTYEEINRVERGGNYGWPCREGMHPYSKTSVSDDPAKCPSKLGLIDPVVEHMHPAPFGRSITGGVVYRGKAIPSFVGTYLYGDYVTGDVFTLSFDPVTGAPKSGTVADAPAIGWVQWAEDLDGEIYGVGLETGQIHKVVPNGAPPAPTFPDRLSKTGCVDASDPKKPSAGLVPYGVNSPLWSDGAAKDRWLAIPDGTKIEVGADGDFAFPIGTVLVKTFSLGGKRIETRLFVRHADGDWGGYSYEWLDDQSDAVLLPSSKRKTVGAQSWYFPSRADCMRCHTQAAGRSLGLELGQQNGDFTYTSTNRVANQLETLEHIGMFAAALGKPPAELPVIPDPAGAAPLDARARAYLHANCSSCHRPNGGGRGNMDLRFSTSFAGTQTCNVTAASGDLGVAGAKLLVPGDPTRSLVSVRPRSTTVNRMPPLATNVVDTAGMGVVDSWIKGLTTCP